MFILINFQQEYRIFHQVSSTPKRDIHSFIKER